MDHDRFDALTKRIGGLATRRRMLQGGLTGLLTAVVAGSEVEEAFALACIKPGRRGCKGPKNRKCCAGSVCRGGSKTKVGRCVCRQRNQRPCGGRCVSEADPNNCGACGRRCREDQICDSTGAGYGCTCNKYYEERECYGRCVPPSGGDYFNPGTNTWYHTCCENAECPWTPRESCVAGICSCTHGKLCRRQDHDGTFRTHCAPASATCCTEEYQLGWCESGSCCHATWGGNTKMPGCTDANGQCKYIADPN